MTKEAALAALTGQVRRQLSLVSARAQAILLLDRVAVLGRGVEAAAGRRRWVEEEERRMGREQQAHILSLEQSCAVLRRRHPPTVNLKALQVKTFFLNCTH